MLAPSPAPWTVRGATFALWALAAGSAVFWALKLGGPGKQVQAPLPPARSVAAADPAAIARLLGSTPAAAVATPLAAAPSLASRFKLLGVAARAYSGAGAAVISVDGKPARPFRVGSPVDEGIVLQSVHGRTATLGADRQGPPLLTLELPPPPHP
jgi:general secretion pathway protein C